MSNDAAGAAARLEWLKRTTVRAHAAPTRCTCGIELYPMLVLEFEWSQEAYVST